MIYQYMFGALYRHRTYSNNASYDKESVELLVISKNIVPQERLFFAIRLSFLANGMINE